jgi:hypothetical protein
MSASPGIKRGFFQENGLSIVWLGLFFLSFLLGQTVFGHAEYNEHQQEHGRLKVTFVEYLGTSHFFEATMENWESEFLQMFLFITLTAFLYQKGSAESKKLGQNEAVDRDPRDSRDKKNAPWPVRRGGWMLRIYENSEPGFPDPVHRMLSHARGERGASLQRGAAKSRRNRSNTRMCSSTVCRYRLNATSSESRVRRSMARQ